MVHEQDKVVAAQPAPTTKEMPPHKGLTNEKRRVQEALEDDDVRESLRELHAQKGKSG
jgi:hypothetical protein